MRLLKKAGLALTAVALLAGGTGTAAVAAPSSGRTVAEDCSHLYLLTDGRGRGLTGKTWDDAHTTVPAGARTEKFLYMDGIVPGVHPHSLDETRRVADPALAKRVVDFHNACPGSRITLVGYSFGALISGDALELLAQKNEVPKNLLNGILIADPRRAVAQHPVHGPAGGIMSVAPDGPGMHTPGARDFKGIKVASICREDDVVCDAANPISNAVAFTGELQRLGDAHGDYGGGGGRNEPNYWANPAVAENVGDLVLPAAPKRKLDWGGPAFPIPMPREILNNNPVYKGVMDGLSQSGDAIAWAKVLDSFGLPGSKIVNGLWQIIEGAGAGW
ncbi:cutinase family protein [Streptomyces sp. NPDC058045]|uniref:cutinase family protein n=1 Tax=Streptomyces sp. NPDC058045 TaxID=3346311 RepID=UPI0036E78C7A